MRNLVLFDLDGTLCGIEHRLHFITNGKKDWEGFFKACVDDVPRPDIIKVFKAMKAAGHEVWIVSGRSSQVQEETIEWLKRYDIQPRMLIMRKQGNSTPDQVLKISWVNDGIIPRERILCVFDDRQRVVDAWRAIGITCLQVAAWKEFDATDTGKEVK